MGIGVFENLLLIHDLRMKIGYVGKCIILGIIFSTVAIVVWSIGGALELYRDHKDSFRSVRGEYHLGAWAKQQRSETTFQRQRFPLHGPKIEATMTTGFCGVNDISLNRLPMVEDGESAWTTVLKMVESGKRGVQSDESKQVREANILAGSLLDANNNTNTEETQEEIGENDGTPPSNAVNPTDGVYAVPDFDLSAFQNLVLHRKKACTKISRTTFITLLSITNARQLRSHSDASGYRALYPSYSGQWYIDWPIGQEARVQFVLHDSLDASKDRYPSKFETRVDKCVQMTCGVVSGQDLQVAFPSRMASGRWVLKFQPRGFLGVHGGRHLYGMNGGHADEVDYLSMSRVADEESIERSVHSISVPSLEKGKESTLIVPVEERKILDRLLDCLPWSNLSWSVHRGMRDILVAYSKQTMDAYRDALARTLKDASSKHAAQLISMGWSEAFVRHTMGDLITSSIGAGRGNSGDVVRAVTDVAFLLCTALADVAAKKDMVERLDKTSFWEADQDTIRDPLDCDAVAALTKVFVLEWSSEFDYQMYHDLPKELLFG